MATASEDATDSAKRSLIVDEAAFEEQFLRCHICHEKFNQEDRHPKSLPCNHTFCLPCLKQVFDHNQQNSRTRRQVSTWLDETLEGVLKCPECRVEIFLSRSEISALPSDHRVIQMMDFLSQVSAKSQNVCSKHENQPLNFFCKKCLVPVCRDCTVLDHKEGQGHNIVDVKEALTENSEDFNKIEQKSKELLDKMRGRTDSLANGSKQLDLLERQLRGNIKDTFIEFRLLLERRQEALMKILRETIKDQKSAINTRFVDVATQGSQLQKLYDEFTKARASNDLRKMFTIQLEIKEKETEYTCTAEANDDELFVASRFNVPNECQFLSEMSGLGEVTTEQDLGLKSPVPPHQLVLLDSLENRQQMQFFDQDDANEQPEGEEAEEPEEPIEDVIRNIRSNARSRARQQMYGEQAYPRPADEREAIASTYLMRIASRLNESAADMAEALANANIEANETAPQEASPPTHSGRSSSSRSRRSNNNVRVVRHPTPPTGSHTSSRESRSADHGHLYPSSRYRDRENHADGH
ncbi:hypothetical protein FSP39_002383 [Pinctada imbricata]|uniref:Uncharacterized protein n=1 Tax=Pinctada imbricata TaxID=66713 RepID=A0AA89BWQ7_PINIB|nr:hypothetical protein FSP39_002383 [Pinctada imbricata]